MSVLVASVDPPRSRGDSERVHGIESCRVEVPHGKLSALMKEKVEMATRFKFCLRCLSAMRF